ncbi:unnamed protein product, partial [marine sediment metagenome]
TVVEVWTVEGGVKVEPLCFEVIYAVVEAPAPPSE